MCIAWYKMIFPFIPIQQTIYMGEILCSSLVKIISSAQKVSSMTDLDPFSGVCGVDAEKTELHLFSTFGTKMWICLLSRFSIFAAAGCRCAAINVMYSKYTGITEQTEEESLKSAELITGSSEHRHRHSCWLMLANSECTV